MARLGLEKVYTEPLIQTRPPQAVESEPSTTSKKDDSPSENGVDLFKSPMVGTFTENHHRMIHHSLRLEKKYPQAKFYVS